MIRPWHYDEVSNERNCLQILFPAVAKPLDEPNSKEEETKENKAY